jgi:hypothetical protein
MAYWDCPRCAAENSLDATCCWRCGFQNYGAAQERAASPPPARRSSDALKRQREGLRDDLSKNIESELERTRASVDRLAGRSRAARRTPSDGST